MIIQLPALGKDAAVRLNEAIRKAGFVSRGENAIDSFPLDDHSLISVPRPRNGIFPMLLGGEFVCNRT